ncbi:MAG: stage III sporulation protein AB [Oscillospiraceae bacterium]|nr:stage III sporulation protein AB [Oscillospiraceae bacterium]
MKIAGLLFLFCSVSALGFEIGSRYISMLKDAKRAELFIKNIILCLENENMTLGEIFENCGKTCDEKTGKFIFSLSERNTKDIGKTALECGFCRNIDVIPALEEAFFVLGKYSAAEQIRELTFCRSRISNIILEHEKPLLLKAKLSGYSGVLAGAFLSILLA